MLYQVIKTFFISVPHGSVDGAFGRRQQIRLYYYGRKRRPLRHPPGKHARSVAQVHRRFAQEARSVRNIFGPIKSIWNVRIKTEKLKSQNDEEKSHSFIFLAANFFLNYQLTRFYYLPVAKI